MTYHLVVTKPFLNFVRGDIIADAIKIGEVLASEHQKFVMKVASSNSLKG
jgi:hypothetical protein